MPNRIIKESALTSPNLDRLSDAAERFFWRLTVVADDFGRFDARPEVLVAKCFPLRVSRLEPASLAPLLHELVKNGLVRTYFAGQSPRRRYGYFVNWDRHQRTRAKESKFPAPGAPSRKPVADIGGQTLPSAVTPPQDAGVSGRSRIRIRESRIGTAAADDRQPLLSQGPEHVRSIIGGIRTKLGIRPATEGSA
jgi:hypothetical protein